MCVGGDGSLLCAGCREWQGAAGRTPGPASEQPGPLPGPVGDLDCSRRAPLPLRALESSVSQVKKNCGKMELKDNVHFHEHFHEDFHEDFFLEIAYFKQRGSSGGCV